MDKFNVIKKNFETCGMLLIDKKEVEFLIEQVEKLEYLKSAYHEDMPLSAYITASHRIFNETKKKEE